MSELIIVQGQFNVDFGGMYFLCTKCQDVVVVGEDLVANAQAVCCGIEHNVIFNRRKDPLSRKTALINSRAKISGCTVRYPLVLKDSGKGGIGLGVHKNEMEIQLVVNQRVEVIYEIGEIRLKSVFYVRSVTDQRIGLKYADGKRMNPAQRTTADRMK